MKRILLVLVFLACSLGAQAQGGFAQVEKEYKLFDFQLNAKRMEFGLNVGHSITSDTKWNDHVAFCINAGYQIPILRWLRLMPLIGYAQTNDGITDASVTIWEIDEDSSDTYHPYKVTRGSRSHYFNYGGGLSIQPCKWFSINLIATNNALYGGVGVDLITIARTR